MDPDNIPDQSKVASVCLRITDFPELPAEATARLRVTLYQKLQFKTLKTENTSQFSIS